MKNGFTVDPEGVEGIARDIDDTAQAMNNHLGTLDAGKRALLGGWTGAASEAYRRTQDAWSAEMDEMVGIAEASAEAARAAAETYRRADDAVARAWRI